MGTYHKMKKMKTLKDKEDFGMNLKHKCFDVEYWEELNHKRVKGNICFEKDIKEHLELFQALIISCELSQEEILIHFLKILGDWEK